MWNWIYHEALSLRLDFCQPVDAQTAQRLDAVWDESREIAPPGEHTIFFTGMTAPCGARHVEITCRAEPTRKEPKGALQYVGGYLRERLAAYVALCRQHGLPPVVVAKAGHINIGVLFLVDSNGEAQFDRVTLDPTKLWAWLEAQNPWHLLSRAAQRDFAD